MTQANIEGFRLSQQQKRIMQLQKEHPQATYRANCNVSIEGKLDAQALQRALEHVVNRHEILRTTFHSVPGLTIPLQVIGEDDSVNLKTDDLSTLKSDEQQARIRQFMAELNSARLDLEEGTLLQFALFKLSDSKHLLYINLPALCADAAALENLVREISRAYANEIGSEGELSDEPMQYVDISEWQNELLESEDAEQAQRFWGGMNFLEVLDIFLPLEKPFLAHTNFEPRTYNKTLPADLRNQLEEVAAKLEVSLPVLLQTCWQILLWRLSGQSDIVIGTVADGRNYEELQGTLGLLSRHLPLRAHLAEDMTFAELARQNETKLEEVLEWQEYFSWEQFSLPDENGGVPAFFPASFEYFDHKEPYSAVQVTLAVEELDACIDRFNLKLSCRNKADTLISDLHYDPELFEETDISRLGDQFEVLVRSVIDNPQATILQHDVLTEAERKLLLVEFNKTEKKLEDAACIQNLVEQQAEKSPDATAVEFENQSLSFSELNTRANQLAHYLTKLDIGPESLVGLCVEPSLETIVGVLGILKAGGAYVPLDPSYPRERLDYMLTDCRAKVLVTQESFIRDQRLTVDQLNVVLLDADWGKIAEEDDTNVATNSTPENLAYVIYTSGSSGQPKGVSVTHRNAVHSTCARLDYYQHTPPGRFLLLSSLAFDSSVAGLFWALCGGGTLLLPKAGLQREQAALAELIDDKKVTHILALPSLYSLLLTEGKPEQLQSLQTVIVAGEACPPNVLERHKQTLPKTQLFNEYGPTEGTVWTTVYDCKDAEAETQVPIGRPIANTEIYLLDALMRPVPLGVSGELCLSGPGLARGYLNRPDLTADKFLPNPFNSEKGSRLYRTGDLARYQRDGNIEFLGRIDQQVKIRGYRIELEEIEAVLSKHPKTKAVAVVAHAESNGNSSPSADKRLVAYVVPESKQDSLIEELRSALQNTLPDYMIPANYIFLDELPLTPNGKVDRKALPEPDRARPDIAEHYVAPRNAVEQVLTGIWADVLGIEKVGVHDSFFDLGGHSILVTQLVSRVRDTLNVDIPLRTLFEIPTVAGLSEWLQKDPEKHAQVEKTAELLIQVADLSDEEAEKLLGEQLATSEKSS